MGAPGLASEARDEMGAPGLASETWDIGRCPNKNREGMH
jgi:hypothetical protein